MPADPEKLQHLIERACDLDPVRVAVVDAAQSVVLETLRDAVALGLVEPELWSMLVYGVMRRLFPRHLEWARRCEI